LALVGIVVGGAGLFVFVKDASDVGFPMIFVGVALLAMVLLAPDHALERLGIHLPGTIERFVSPTQPKETANEGESSEPEPRVVGGPQSPPSGEPPPAQTAPVDVEKIGLALQSEDAGVQLSAIEQAESLRGSLDDVRRQKLRETARRVKVRGGTRQDRSSRKKRIDSLIALLGDE
jgi:hypothetical protein